MINVEDLHKAIDSSIRTEISKIIDDEAAKAAKRVEERVRGLTGQIAAKVVSHFSIERFGPDIRITVKLPEKGLEA